jgi:bifunctional ADP-heptose synthase (sugar kinase/adenylyltransferase)
MLTDATIEQILTRTPTLRIGVLGDLFLDRYLEIDAGLTEPSLETGLDAYQVVGVRSQPGAAGTVINNLAALGIGRIDPIAVIGDDGEGHELRQALAALEGVALDAILACDGRRTPTYTKPMLLEMGKTPRELNRLDIKNRSPLPPATEDCLLTHLDSLWPRLDSLIVLDQVSEPECGVITTRVRQRLKELGSFTPARFILADSRERIELFQGVSVKPNERELQRALGEPPSLSALPPERVDDCLGSLMNRTRSHVFCTRGSIGMRLGMRSLVGAARFVDVPAFPVKGPIDVVGAGDSASAGIACAVAAGATLEDAAAFGNLVASITIQQIGTTGTASPEQVRQRWREVQSAR